MRTHHGISRLNRFLHHFAQLAGLRNLAFAGHIHRFDKQNIAADFRPGQPGRYTDMVLLFGFAVAVTSDTEILVQIFGTDRTPASRV